MAGKKAPLKASRRPSAGDVEGSARRAREFAARLRNKYPDRQFLDSAEIVRRDRDTRDGGVRS